MRLLITGSRTLGAANAAKGIAAGLDTLAGAGYPAPTLLLHGGAVGADEHADVWARAAGLPVQVFRPDYEHFPVHVAPLLRNQALVDAADAVLALYGAGRARKGGTWDTVQRAIAAGRVVVELRVAHR